jgi:DNA-binding MarR family transcriptional regulator
MEPPVAEQAPRSVGFLISQLGFFSSRGFMEALEPVGIGPREFLLMRFVEAAPGQSQQALAERLGVPASRMVAVVDHLEEAALVERRADPADRRVRGLCAGINREEREQLIDLLQKLQAGQTNLKGVHPGLGQEESA